MSMMLLSTTKAAKVFLDYHQPLPTKYVSVSPRYPFGGLFNSIKLGTSIGKRQGLQIWMQAQMEKATGFGQQRTEGKTKHKIVTLDPSKAEVVKKFDIFARKIREGEPISKWESIGEILLENESDLEIALKERRKKLLAAAKHQYPSFVLLNIGEEVQYGFRKAAEETTDSENKDEITVVDVRGTDPDKSIPALLRADDGVKPAKRF